MKGRRLAPWLLVLCLVSCGPDGGTSGTGITGGTSGTGVNSETVDTTVEGNVSDLRQARRGAREGATFLARARRFLTIIPQAIAQGGVEGIRVAVEGTSAEGWTDWDGYFSFAGGFAEEVTVLFERDGRQARLATRIPSGGTLTLEDVSVDFDSGEARVERRGVRFEAIVRETDCPSDRIRVSSRFTPEGSLYTVHTDGASIESRDGRPLVCRELRPGDAVTIEGPISQDGTVGGEGSRARQNVVGNLL